MTCVSYSLTELTSQDLDLLFYTFLTSFYTSFSRRLHDIQNFDHSMKSMLCLCDTHRNQVLLPPGGSGRLAVEVVQKAPDGLFLRGDSLANSNNSLAVC